MKRAVIYQLFVRLFSNTTQTNQFNGTIEINGCGKFNHINNKALHSLVELGCTHIWFTGVLEQASATDYPELNRPADPLSICKGKAGSPYAIRDYYDLSPDLAINTKQRHQEFTELIERTHQHGLKALIDFVPNHVARTYQSDQKPEGTSDFGANDNKENAFAPQNNFYYIPNSTLKLPVEGNDYTETPARATGNDIFSAEPGVFDWYETVKLNYGIDYLDNNTTHFEPIPDTWNKMVDILLYWTAKGIDGFRCDMAGMVPPQFWNYAIGKVKEKYPETIFIAEIYEPWRYNQYLNEARFDYLYDKEGFYDITRAVITNTRPASAISDIWKSLNGIDNKMVRFIENHDEQRVASPHFANDPHKGVLATALAAWMNTNPVMIYNGQESCEKGDWPRGFSGDDGRTSIFDYGSMTQHLNWVNSMFYDGGKLNNEQHQIRTQYSFILNSLHRFSSLREGQFYDLMYVNTQNDGFPENEFYTFLRHTPKQIMLIAIRFSGKQSQLKIRIPGHALITSGMRPTQRGIFRQVHGEGLISVPHIQPSGDVVTEVRIPEEGYYLAIYQPDPADLLY